MASGIIYHELTDSVGNVAKTIEPLLDTAKDPCVILGESAERAKLSKAGSVYRNKRNGAAFGGVPFLGERIITNMGRSVYSEYRSANSKAIGIPITLPPRKTDGSPSRFQPRVRRRNAAH